MGILDGKTLLVTGVLMDSSIAFHVARLAQEEGATVILTSFGRTMKITQTIAKRLPTTPVVVELDVADQEHLDTLAERLGEHTDHLDGVLHSIGFAPQGAFSFLDASWEDVSTAIHISAYSLKALAVACAPLMRDGGSVVGLTRRARPSPAVHRRCVASCGGGGPCRPRHRSACRSRPGRASCAPTSRCAGVPTTSRRCSTPMAATGPSTGSRW